jgi:hypothetical protein
MEIDFVTAANGVPRYIDPIHQNRFGRQFVGTDGLKMFSLNSPSRFIKKGYKHSKSIYTYLFRHFVFLSVHLFASKDTETLQLTWI